MKKDIAIIGMSGRFPKSGNIETFWNNLLAEKELIHFFTDRELEEKGMDQKKRERANYVKVSSFVTGTDEFDYPLFKYTIHEARVMNPQTRMMHQLVWEALEDAACNVELYNKKVGIFLGANKDLGWSFHSTVTKTEHVDDLTKRKMANPNFMASLISYKLNFKGPCYFIDTACSTSLSTAHLACRSLLLNECGVAVVGGIRLLSEEDTGYIYQEGTIMSKDGHNRSFDSNSSGTVPCDGAGVVILKRVEDAIKDNDHIYAVIRGSAMNNDGNDKAGYTMPSVNGQAECIRLAHKIAGVTPAEISYVETHGTGTRIGDPIEIEALNKAFNNDRLHKCAIGTIKSNMGHADEAAGIAGLIKTTLALKHRMLPASLHYQSPNITIPFSEGPFYVNKATTEWQPVNNAPLVAGVSSLGIGGTNVHMVLQEAPEARKGKARKGHQLIRYSANTAAALERYEAKLLHFLQQKKDVNLTDVAYTLQTGRKHFDYGRYIIAKDNEELITTLQAGKIKTYTVKPKSRIVFMFSGQGSQYVNMGKHLYEEHTLFREIMDNGFARLQELKGIDYKKVLFTEGEEINETFYTQPVLFLFEYALAQLLMSFGIHPSHMIGHSLGEYVAATISGVFSLDDALKVVSARAALMAGVAAGDMISVGTSLQKVSKTLINGTAIAAVNAHDSFVLSGTRQEMTSIKEQLIAEEISFIALKTSHAFHSGMMEVIIDDFEKVLNSIQLNKPVIPVISNLTGEVLTAEQATSPAYWSGHILGTVQFEKGIKQLIAMDHTLFIEVGPGRTLATFFKKSQNPALENAVLTTIKHPKEQVEDDWFLANFLGNLGMHGITVNWDNYYGAQLPNKRSIPTYAFEPYNVPAKVSIEEALLNKEAANRSSRQIRDAFYLPSWKQQPVKPATDATFAAKENYLVLSDGSAFCEQLISKIKAGNKKVMEVRKGDVDHEDLTTHLKTLQQVADVIVYAWDLGNEHTNQPAYNAAFNNLLQLVNGLELMETADPKKIIFLSNRNYAVTGAEHIRTFNQHVATLLNVLSQERAHIYATVIDLDLDHYSIDAITGEFEDAAKYSQVAFRNNRRWAPYYEPLPVTDERKPFIKQQGTYLVTGHLDDIEYTLAAHLLTEYRANVIILSPEPQHQKGEQLYAKLAALPGKIVFVHAGITAANIEKLVTQYGPINGVIHTAKHTSAGAIAFANDITAETIEQHFISRVNGLLNIDSFFKNRPVDFITVISSLSSFLGGISYGAYAAAATLMDNLALHARQTKTKWSVINIDRVHKEEPWIQEQELIAVLYGSFLYNGAEQIIVSKRDIHNLQAAPVQESAKTGISVEMNRNQLRSSYKAPENETETRLVNLFGELFGMQGIGMEDDFFELGGDSLKAVVLINRLKKEMGIEITIAEMFANKTAYDLSLLVTEKKWLGEAKHRVNELII